MSLFGSKHKLQASFTMQDSSSLETITASFKLQSGHNTGAAVTEFYRGSQETGGESHLEEAAPTPLAVDYSKPAVMAADSESCCFWPFWASWGGSGSSPLTISGASPAMFEHEWSGPNTNYVVAACSAEDLGDFATNDTDFNRSVHNVTVERYVLSGKRRGLLTCEVGLRGGATAGAPGGTGTSVAVVRSKLYNFGMVRCLTDDAGWVTTAQTNWFNGGTIATTFPTSGANCITLSQLASPTDVTSSIQEFQVIATQAIDLQRSMAPGNLTAEYAGYVPTNVDWIYTNEAQQVEFEMVFNQNDTSGEVEKLMLEYQAGTRRSWEIWVVHPAADAAATPDGYYGVKWSCANMSPVSWAEENDSFGERYVRVRYRANWDTTKNFAWHFAGTCRFATAFGS